MSLPTDAKSRKDVPVASVLDYFTEAIIEVARVIRQGQVQHNTSGWARGKSTDHSEALVRHFLDRGTEDTDGLRHSAKVAWRALALLQEECERDGAPLSRASVVEEPKQLSLDFGTSYPYPKDYRK